jgi:hypothetical protein
MADLINVSFDLAVSECSSKLGNSKLSYKDRKIEHKLKKYQATIKQQDNINRITEGSSQVKTKSAFFF